MYRDQIDLKRIREEYLDDINRLKIMQAKKTVRLEKEIVRLQMIIDGIPKKYFPGNKPATPRC